MTAEEHQQRHVELHRAFDELFADFITHTKGGTESKIMDLIEWSYSQTKNPTPENGGVQEPMRPVGPIRPMFLSRDSQSLSPPDYAAIARAEKRRALCLTITIVCLLVVAACLYLTQS